jgi:hypothetical protein
LDQSEGVDSTMTSYKPSPQARYLVAKMAELEQNLVAAVNKLSMKIDSYDKRITTLKSDISKVRSQVDLSMRSIQALQKELVLLLHTMNTRWISGGSGSTIGVMGQSPAFDHTTTPSKVPPCPPL